MMNKRRYNIFFNTHTVSGIVISVALYIIFFTGAFALFKDEIEAWQEGNFVSNTEKWTQIDFDTLLGELDTQYELTGRDVSLRFNSHTDKVRVFMSASKDSLASEKGKQSHFFYKNLTTKEEKNYTQNYNLGEFLYRLHFLDPVVYPIGRYLSGFVAFFFLFAIVTGVIVHWKKIIPNFFTFNPKAALKRVWTDAHTAFGIIGLPFQFIFAVTGAYFMLGVLVLLPASFLYDGNQEKLMADLRPERANFEWTGRADKPIPSFNKYIIKTQERWTYFQVDGASIKNYGGTTMQYIIRGELTTEKRFIGVGRVTYDAYNDKILAEKNPNELSYVEDSQRVFGRLHFADFGGYSTKIIYFLLALITCFVIITGVLIWVEARNKKSMTLAQRLYTAKVGHIYLATCLTMLPVTALSFLFVKLTHNTFEDPKQALYSFYFIVWGLFILYFRFKRNNYYTNKMSLLLGALFGLLVPITNGLVSNNWVWHTLHLQQYEIATVDILWVLLSATSLLVYFKIKPQATLKSASNQHPIDYSNLKTLKEAEKQTVSMSKKTDNYQIKQLIKNQLTMRFKIIILWTLIVFGYIFHHLYGLATLFFKESIVMEGATGEVPVIIHVFRILMEGSALLFVLLTLFYQHKIFQLVSLIWATVVALFNVYHFVEELMGNPEDFSKLFILLITAVVSVVLVFTIQKWRKQKE